MRAGLGVDFHKLVTGRPLVLGGVTVPWEKGLLGHSDADVLAHAIIDALLGAAGLGDIGSHFPDTDQSYAGADSIDLLRKVLAMVQDKGFRLGNIDSVIIAEEPVLAPYLPRMRESLAGACSLPEDRVSVKATTSEGLGFAGRGEGIESRAIVMLSAPGGVNP